MIRRLNIRDRIRQDTQLTRGISEQLMEDQHVGEGEATVQPLERIRLNPHNPRRLPMGMEAIRTMAESARADIGIAPDATPSEALLDALATRIEAITDPREREAMEELLVLAASIYRNTLVQPIAIERLAEGDFQVIAGERRYLAHLLLGRASIRAMLRQGGDALRSRLIALAENVARVDLSLAERINAIEEVIQVYGEINPGTEMTGVALSRLIHEPKRTCQRYIKFLGAPKAIRQAIDSGELGTVREVEEALKPESPEPEMDLAVKKTPQKKPRRGAPKTKVKLGTVEDSGVILAIMRAVVGEERYMQMYAMLDPQDLESIEEAWRGFINMVAKRAGQ